MSTLHATAPQRLGKSMKGAVTGSYNAHCVEDMGHANVNKDLDRQQSFLDKMRTELRESWPNSKDVMQTQEESMRLLEAAPKEMQAGASKESQAQGISTIVGGDGRFRKNYDRP
eukprot:scaffold91427_cov18-Tisochrysis_lutea.AAC.1